MIDIKFKTPFIALIGAVALMASAPAFAQAPAPTAEAAAAVATADAAAPALTPAAPVAAAEAADPPQMENAGKLTVMGMFGSATLVVKAVMIGLILASMVSWFLLVTKMIEFNGMEKVSNGFMDAFRGTKTYSEAGRVALSEDFAGNPLADMAAAAVQEVELSRQAGLNISGEHRETTLHRAEGAVNAVQATLGKRLSSGMQFLASVGSGGPFIGLFGTVYGIMNSFIGIANTNTTNLAVVAPGIAEALLATGIGLFAAIPAVIFYNYFQSRISSFGGRSESFVAELMNSLSRQLDKGA
ncbi:MAG: MotA/TolQ/ExbB proton channel family protein [Phenylobacterium sp.]|jgi:biopolymer transport protein ExbB